MKGWLVAPLQRHQQTSPNLVDKFVLRYHKVLEIVLQRHFLLLFYVKKVYNPRRLYFFGRKLLHEHFGKKIGKM